MNHYCNANHVLRKEFKEHARSVTAQVVQASLVAEAKRCGRYLYLNSSQIDKDQVARAIADQQPVNEGLVCVLQALETCWTFDVNSVKGVLKVQGERGKCSSASGPSLTSGAPGAVPSVLQLDGLSKRMGNGRGLPLAAGSGTVLWTLQQRHVVACQRIQGTYFPWRATQHKNLGRKRRNQGKSSTHTLAALQTLP
jgi:hypothetical protein